MKKILTFSFLSLLFLSVYSQNVGVGTIAPDASAKLDISASDKGLLIPRVNLTALNAATPITSPATGLMVYNTNVALSSGEGFYYWNGSAWIKFSTGVASTEANNALSVSNDTVQLGGDLLKNTTIAQGNFNLINDLTGTGNFEVRKSGATDLFISGTNGNIGIKNSNPTNLLDIATATRSGTHPTGLGLYVTANSNASANGVEFRHSNGTQGIGFGYNTIYATGSNANQDLGLSSKGTGVLLFNTNGAERMRVTDNGRVGINTASTILGSTYGWASLEVVGNGSNNGDILLKGIGAFPNYLTWQTAGGTYPTPALVGTNQSLAYTNYQAHNGTNFLTVASSTVGIEGTPTATSLPSFINFATTPINSTNQLERVRINQAGNLGINTTSPTEKLHVNGNIRFSNALMPNNLAGTTGQVLTSAGAGVAPTWSSAAAALGTDTDANDGLTVTYPNITVNVLNGLSLVNDNVKLGGALDQATTITEGAFDMIYDLTGTGNFEVRKLGATDLFISGTNGYVGIGTNVPQTNMEIRGSLIVGGVAGNFSNSNAVIHLRKNGLNPHFIMEKTGANTGGLAISSTALTVSGERDIDFRTGTGNSTDWTTNGTSRLFIQNTTGTIGINNTTPNRAILEQNGMIGNTSAIFGASSSGISLVTNYPGLYFNAYYNGGIKSLVAGYSGNITLDPTNGKTMFSSHSNATAADEVVTASENMVILNNGNIGIGTSAPVVKLAINGVGTNIYGTDMWVENNIHVQGSETLTTGGRGRLRIGTAWSYTGLYAEANSANVANDLVLGAISGQVRIGPGTGSVQSLLIPNGKINTTFNSATTPSIVSFNTNATGTGLASAGNNQNYYYLTEGSGGAFTGTQFGVFGYSSSNTNTITRAGGLFLSSNWGAYAYVGSLSNTNVARKIEGVGTVNTTVKDLNNNRVLLSAPEAPENLFEDYGKGQLTNGFAHIDIDPIFAKNIIVNQQHDLRVFIQLEGDCKGVFVMNKTGNSFEVKELGGGTSNTRFTYHIIANRADEVLEDGTLSRYSMERFAPAMGPQEVKTVEQK